MTEAGTGADDKLDASTFERIGAVCVGEAEEFVLGVVPEHVQSTDILREMEDA
jgi:hypothetical protein